MNKENLFMERLILSLINKQLLKDDIIAQDLYTVIDKKINNIPI